LHHTFNIDGKTRALWLSRSSEGYCLELAGGWSGPVALVEKRKGEACLIVDGRSEPVIYVVDGDLVHVHLGGQSYAVRYIDPLVALSGVADAAGHPLRSNVKNYITPTGLRRLRDERRFLLTRERPAVTQVVAWAASNGDRSENADYQYNKRRLRQIDRRIRFLTKRIDAAEVVDPEAPRHGRAATQVFFGATVRYANAAGRERVVSIVGVDEVDLNRNYISWVSPVASALVKSGPGDRVVLRAPGGTEHLEILEVRYERIEVKPFREPPGAEATPRP